MNTCAQCQHFIQLAAENPNAGLCHGLPPTVFSGGHSARPATKAKDMACSLFKALPEGVATQVKVKKNPETPASARR